MWNSVQNSKDSTIWKEGIVDPDNITEKHMLFLCENSSNPVCPLDWKEKTEEHSWLKKKTEEEIRFLGDQFCDKCLKLIPRI